MPQVIRHKLVDMAMRINCTRAFLNATAQAVAEKVAITSKAATFICRHLFRRYALPPLRLAAVTPCRRDLIQAVVEGQHPVAEICQLKNLATTNMELVATEAVEILGGMGYMEVRQPAGGAARGGRWWPSPAWPGGLLLQW